jgi:RNA polymerase sigma-70 factor (ECF subfamily)
MESNAISSPEKWVDQYGDQLYRYAITRVNDTDTCADLVQETFLSALKGLSEFRAVSTEKTWLFAILKNKIIDYYRKQASSKLTAMTFEAGDEDWFDENGHWKKAAVPASWQVTEDSMEKKDFHRIIRQCKEKLKTLQQQVFTLRYLEEMDGDKICKVLDLAPSNYWVMLHRIRLQMRSCVEKNWLNAQ